VQVNTEFPSKETLSIASIRHTSIYTGIHTCTNTSQVTKTDFDGTCLYSWKTFFICTCMYWWV